MNENDYKLSVIYIITHKQDKQHIYVGSTTHKNYIKRLYSHKYQSKHLNNTNKNLYLYQFIHSKGGWNNFRVDIIETFSAKSKRELVEREMYWLNKLLPDIKYSLNSIIH